MLVQLTSPDGDPVWINPAAVALVRRQSRDRTSIYILGDEDGVTVSGEVADVVQLLIGRKQSAARKT